MYGVQYEQAEHPLHPGRPAGGPIPSRLREPDGHHTQSGQACGYRCYLRDLLLQLPSLCAFPVFNGNRPALLGHWRLRQRRGDALGNPNLRTFFEEVLDTGRYFRARCIS